MVPASRADSLKVPSLIVSDPALQSSDEERTLQMLLLQIDAGFSKAFASIIPNEGSI